ncbi:hypothetical protein K490DRAFT_49964, partial [Saccharata proteae CBS 121410]
PELRAPKFEVRIHDSDHVSPGYWFVAPYDTNNDWDHDTPLWEACQVGPHIYDNNGELVWSGACLVGNRNSFDFRKIDYEGQKYLSMNVAWGEKYMWGAGLVLDESYNVVQEVSMSENTDSFNQHEFNVINNGKTALYVTQEGKNTEGACIGLGESKTYANTNGFREVEIASKSTIFDWNSLDHIPLNESSYEWPSSPDRWSPGWDYLHMNSVDKFADGDYLISARYTNCIMKVSAEDKSIVWRFGGKSSNFTLEDFEFSRQHHARILSSNTTHTIISFLDNASGSKDGDTSSTSDYSSGMIVSLDLSAMKATLLNRYVRPDRGLTHLRGDFQTLPNGNVFLSWSEHGYQSEATADGKTVMEARFASNRFDTYRAYKFSGFVGKPTEPPVIKTFAFGAKASSLTTICYMSWNGATEVVGWNIFGKSAAGTEAEYLATASRTGFETVFMLDGLIEEVFAQAIDNQGNALGSTAIHTTIVPYDWRAAGFGHTEDVNGDDAVLSSVAELDEDESAYGFSQYQKSMSKPRLPKGVIAVIVMASVLAAGSMSGLAFVLYRRRMYRREEDVDDDEKDDVDVALLPEQKDVQEMIEEEDYLYNAHLKTGLIRDDGLVGIARNAGDERWESHDAHSP